VVIALYVYWIHIWTRFHFFAYLQAKSVSDEFIYDEYRQKKIREKIDEKIASRVKTKVRLHIFLSCIFWYNMCCILCKLASIAMSDVSQKLGRDRDKWCDTPEYLRVSFRIGKKNCLLTPSPYLSFREGALPPSTKASSVPNSRLRINT